MFRGYVGKFLENQVEGVVNDGSVNNGYVNVEVHFFCLFFNTSYVIEV